jgi:hypothetical protein
VAEAVAIEEQVRAYGGPQYRVTQQVMSRFAEAIEQARVDVVPKILIGQGGSASGTNGHLLEGLLAMLLSDKVTGAAAPAQDAPRSPKAEQIRAALREAAILPVRDATS